MEAIVSTANPKRPTLWASLVEAIRGSHQDYTTGSLNRAILLLAVPIRCKIVAPDDQLVYPVWDALAEQDEVKRQPPVFPLDTNRRMRKGKEPWTIGLGALSLAPSPAWRVNPKPINQASIRCFL